ncbi:PMT multi-domain protein [Desulfurococcus amylolyticus DSM 16532]|uniref:PMT multi-domain protein n=1 Tax=Desulfurococcus amylolyticus DSM 16532 TaxID=768672 RepID=I3XT37_DESAM|nr:PMT multi-domain protein [Desulfurococcus amylolyticus DSM 16532]
MSRVDTVILLLIVLVGILVRVPFLWTTCGSDVVQFAGFADTFLHHGFHFYDYNYLEAPGNNWPYPWKYIYGPVLLLILAPLRLIAPDPVKVVRDYGLNIYASPSWCGIVKSVFSLFDVLTGILIYYTARRIFSTSRLVAAIASLLYLLNPMTIYISAIYGMFDNMALFFLLLGLYMYMDSRHMLAGLFIAGFSVSVKQTILPSLLVLITDIFKKHGLSGTSLKYIMVVLTGALVPFTPFIIASPGTMGSLLNALLESSKPGYTEPVVYSFNGLSSLITYNFRGYIWVIESWWVFFTVITLSLLLLYYKQGNTLLLCVSLAYIAFTAFYWRVNHQYLVPLIAYISLLLVTGENAVSKPLLLFTYIWIGLWPVAFPTSWWSHVHIENPDVNIWRLLDSITLMIFDPAFYVAYSLALTTSFYIIIGSTMVHWLKQLMNKRSAAAGI